MSARTGQSKFKGSPGDLLQYYQELSDDSLLAFEGYYKTDRDTGVFSRVGGKAARRLPGLDLSIGLTRSQHANLHNGRWGKEKLVKGGYEFLYVRDDDGNEVKVQDIVTRRWRKVPVMKKVPILDKNGNPTFADDGKQLFVIDEMTGKPLEKHATRKNFVSGHDVSFSLSKDWSEFIIAHPEHVELVKKCLLEAVDTTMRIVVEGQSNLVVITENGHKTKVPAELIWFTVFGSASRPTEKAIERGYEVDPHVHAHCFLSSVAYAQGKWRKVDGKELWQKAELRRDMVSNEFDRLMESHGLRLEYSKPDLQGRIYSTIEGSSEEVRDFFSTNRDRAIQLERQFETKHNRPPTNTELKQLMGMTKLAKSKKAKAADELGNLDQIKLWAQALEKAKYVLTVMAPTLIPKIYPAANYRRQVLFERLESPTGVARDCDASAVFGPEVILPAVARQAQGLGFSADELVELAEVYRTQELVPMREAKDPKNRLYTTRALLAAEQFIGEAFEVKASKPVEAVSPTEVWAALRSQEVTLDHEQEALAKRICGTERVVHGIGAAGTGKNATLKPAVEALRRSALVDNIIVVAVMRGRAEDTARSIGANRGWSVRALREAVESGRFKPDSRTLVVLDEVALFNSFDIAQTLEDIGDARLITIGDDRQLTAIGAAGWYSAELESRPASELTKVYRQKHWEDRAAFQMIREGDAHAGIDNLIKRKRVFVADNPQLLTSRVQERWDHYRAEGYKPDEIAILNQGSNRYLDDMNRTVQRARMADITDEAMSEFSPYFEVHEHGGRHWRVYKGDRIVFNEGVWLATEPIRNGSQGEVIRISEQGDCRVRLDDRREVTIQLKKEAAKQPVGLAYCMSNVKYQGNQVKVGLILPGNPNIASLNSGYSAMTRIIEKGEVFLDYESWGDHPAHALGEAWSRTAEKVMASKLFDLRPEPEVEEQGIEVSQAEAIKQIEDVRQQLQQNRGISL